MDNNLINSLKMIQNSINEFSKALPDYIQEVEKSASEKDLEELKKHKAEIDNLLSKINVSNL